MIHISAFLLMLGILAQGLNRQAVLPDPDPDKDIHAIYALMLGVPRDSPLPRHGISDTTGGELVEEPCVDVPPERAKDLVEVMRDYQKRKGIPRKMRRSVWLDAPPEPDPAPRARREPPLYPKRIVTLSDVYFNVSRTLAIASLFVLCGQLCGSFDWHVFEKLPDGKWVERRWVTCGAIF